MFCECCNKDIVDIDIVWELEDNTFTVPYGDTFVDSGSVDNIPKCPDCGEELQEATYE